MPAKPVEPSPGLARSFLRRLTSRISRRTRFVLATTGLDMGDAISHDVFGMATTLRDAGYEAEVYADYLAPSVGRKARPARQISLRPADVLIYHHSIYWERGGQIWDRASRRVIKYHNVTPPDFFRGYSAKHVEGCRLGRQQTETLVRGGADLYLADSDYNLQELIQAGADPAKAQAVPPFHALDQGTPDFHPLQRFLDGRPNVLFVGRFVPNKNHLAMLRVFAYFRDQIEPDARLILVGKPLPEAPQYADAYVRFASVYRNFREAKDFEDFIGSLGETS